MQEEPGSEGTHNLWEEKTEELPKQTSIRPTSGLRNFKRQLVLLEEVMNLQKNCFHILSLANSSTVTCVECGAVWIK